MNPVIPPFFFVFDVESVGLHGEPFAVGWVIIDTASGREVGCGILVSSMERAANATTHGHSTQPSGAPPDDVEWVRNHVMPAIAGVPLCHQIRRPFWVVWKRWEKRGALLAADVAWPVEARFLMECCRYTFWREANKPELQPGPYPLIDIASVRLAKGFDPIATDRRMDDEMPPHNPLCDARQSARLLMEALRT